jgi:hypothetical protein
VLPKPVPRRAIKPLLRNFLEVKNLVRFIKKKQLITGKALLKKQSLEELLLLNVLKKGFVVVR